MSALEQLGLCLLNLVHCAVLIELNVVGLPKSGERNTTFFVFNVQLAVSSRTSGVLHSVCLNHKYGLVFLFIPLCGDR